MSEKDIDGNLDSTDIQALHELQLGMEKFKMAHGNLVEFHHNIGSGMEHYRRAMEMLEDSHPELAEEIAPELARGVVEGRWSWSIVEEFEEFFMENVREANNEVRDELADGEEHINEFMMEERRRDKYE